ncbi:LAQU0S04e07910g1_1 [Lachancea quebecensis]|uniref:LAQU0S04e07910g1_1 n=1 Tax=Lachancea quebecensis TaxID=1654605 RepID=A0A0P1KRK0_9SACH|nr:LAQU0S04e07910g1_1 [Lachancea quebecensis]
MLPTALSLVALLATSLAEPLISPLLLPQLTFVCLPRKASQARSHPLDDALCFTFEVGPEPGPLTFAVEVSNTLRYKVDWGRAGPSSGERGKQSLDVSITDSRGNLLRGRRGLPVGRTILHLACPDYATSLKFCFANLVFDGSWKSIDFDKTVTVALLNCDSARKEALETELRETRSRLEAVSRALFPLVAERQTQELFILERQRRNVNEDTFPKILWHQVLVCSAVCISNVLVMRYAISRAKRGPVRRSAKDVC